MQNITNESGSIIWDHIKTLVNQMTPEQLQMKVIFSIADKQDGEVESISILPEDFYSDDEFIEPASTFTAVELDERTLTYRQGQPIIDIDLFNNKRGKTKEAV